ncbi:winged helix DNA-binding protein [Bradyrhizobium sediminis]|uniref:Winged helix DNA-binding protein n=1 Tax=Bradyrhizobium sediminis TaxID=2840469 RepID=A0A975NA19_9BRAD|nr:MarR family transcriptional regulator [Bradyrhizobium sediminis]QWG11282.1 winged helix DNA-binding protein [Bradyrhizobium sediminis]
MAQVQTATDREASDGVIDLQRFFPYRLAVLAEEVSRTVAQLYSDRFDLTRHEWRVLAALAANRQMAAKDVAGYTTLDKMSVSRAVAALETKAYLTREEDPADRRNKILRLTPAGRALYQKIVPLARARERHILDALTSAERAALDVIMKKLLGRARDLRERG